MRGIPAWERKRCLVCKSFNFQDLFLWFQPPLNHPTPATAGCLCISVCVCICVWEGRGDSHMWFRVVFKDWPHVTGATICLAKVVQRVKCDRRCFSYLCPTARNAHSLVWGLSLLPNRQKSNVVITDVSDVVLLCVISYNRAQVDPVQSSRTSGDTKKT